jgi:hypothetical protein
MMLSKRRIDMQSERAGYEMKYSVQRWRDETARYGNEPNEARAN